MADTLEYAEVAFPKERFTAELIDELRRLAPSMIEEQEDTLIVKHLYIERRMIPLNMYVDNAQPNQLAHAVRDYGDAIRQLAAANIFPGDMLFKNFGVTRFGRIVFYDYDEIVYMTDCNFRRMPLPRTPEDEISAEPWYPVGAADVFPEEFAAFLLGDSRVREVFLENHRELLDVDFWASTQRKIAAGHVEDVFPYPETLRFRNRFAGRTA
jgi:isocitrate dehydrogenase kinase/phosphatase